MPATFIRAPDADIKTVDILTDSMVDVAGAHSVQIEINKKSRVVHVNVNGVCLLRIQQIEVLEVNSRGR